MLDFVNVSMIHNRKKQIYSLCDVNYSFGDNKNTAVLAYNDYSSLALMNLISGIQTPTRGRIDRHGVFAPPLGVSSYYHRELSGEENIRFICRIYNQNANEIIEEIKIFANLNKELKDKVKRYPSSLRRKIVISMSLFMKSDMYLLKDSLSHPDKKLNSKIQDKLTEISNVKKIIIFSNNMKLVKKYAENVVLIDRFGNLSYFNKLASGIDAYRKLKNAEDEYSVIK